MTPGEFMLDEARRASRRPRMRSLARSLGASAVIGAPPRRTRPAGHVGLVGSPDTFPGVPGEGFASGPDGVVCGCHQPNCGACKATRGCGWAGCPTCLEYAYLGTSARSCSGTTLGDFSPGIVDSHAHDSGTSYADLSEYLTGRTSDAGDGIARLEALATATPPVRSMFLSAQFNPHYGPKYIRDSRSLNQMTAQAASANPGYFYPFVMIQPDELSNTSGDPAAEAEHWLTRFTNRFVGVGELFIHGHHEHFDGDPTGATDNLLDVCEVAREAGVPVDLAGMQVGDPDSETTDALQRLYYTDGSGADVPTSIGAELLTRMATYSDRFMLGTDSNDAVATSSGGDFGMDDRALSIAKYIAFLGMGSLTAAQKRQIRIQNALDLVS